MNYKKAYLYIILIIAISFVNCKNNSNEEKNVKNDTADMEYVSEKTEDDGYNWYEYRKNYGTDSIQCAVVDAEGHFLTRIYQGLSYNYNINLFEGAISYTDPDHSHEVYGYEFLDKNLNVLIPSELLICAISRRDFKDEDEETQLYTSIRKIDPFNILGKGEKYGEGCLDKDLNEVLMPIYERVAIAKPSKNSSDAEKRLLVKFDDKYFVTDYIFNDGEIKKTREPEFKGFFSYNIGGDNSVVEVLLYDKRLILHHNITEDRFSSSFLRFLTLYSPTEEDGIMKFYRHNGKSYYEVDEEYNITLVQDYYDDDDNYVYNRYPFHRMYGDAHGRLKKYEDAYYSYFEDIKSKVRMNGSMTSEELWAFGQGIPEELPHGSTSNSGQTAAPIITAPSQPMSPGVYNPGSSNSEYNEGSHTVSTPSSSDSPCQKCYGTGQCNTCNGTGEIWNEYGMSGKSICPNCRGHKGLCSRCGGSGRR